MTLSPLLLPNHECPLEGIDEPVAFPREPEKIPNTCPILQLSPSDQDPEASKAKGLEIAEVAIETAIETVIATATEIAAAVAAEEAVAVASNINPAVPADAALVANRSRFH